MITVRDFTNKISQYSLIKEPEYANIIENLKKYNRLDTKATLSEKYQALKDIVESVESFSRAYPHSKKIFDLHELSSEAKTEVLSFYKAHRNTPVKKEAFTVATSNVFSEELESYFEFWEKLNPEYKFKLYYDSEAHAAHIMLKFFKDSAGKEVIKKLKQNYEELYDFHRATFSNESLKTIYKMKKDFKQFFKNKRAIDSNIKAKDIISEFLTTKHGYDKELFEKEMNAYNSYFEKKGAIDIRKNVMSHFNSDVDHKLYEHELFVKLNSFDASNILKLNILDKVGGVYIDTNYLPSIKKNIFSGIPVPHNLKRFSKDMIQQLKLITIMKNKKYVKGFDREDINGLDRYNKELSDELRATMSKSLEKFKNSHEIFEKVGDLSTSELGFLTDIKSNYENPVIAAHPNSLATKAILQQMRARYKILNEVYDKIESKNDTYDGARLSLIDEIKTNEKPQLREFLLSTRYYMENGFLDIDYRYHPSKHLNGYRVLRGAARNILELKPFNTLALKEVSNVRLYSLFTLPKIEVTYFSEESLRRDKNIYMGGKNHYYDIAKKSNIEIVEHATPKKETMSLTSLTRLANDKDRFIYEKDYVNVIFQLQSDDITYNTAKDIFAKYPENSILIQVESNSNDIIYLDAQTKEVVSKKFTSNESEAFKSIVPNNLKNFKKMKINLVGHGSVNTVYRKSPTELMEYMKEHFSKLPHMFEEIKQLEISFVCCKNFNLEVKLEDTYPVRFLSLIKDTENHLKSLVKSNIENISISTSSCAISRTGGRLTINPYASSALNKEDAVLRGLVPRYLIKYDKNGEIIVKPKAIKEALEIRNSLEASAGIRSERPLESANNSTLDELGLLLDYEHTSLEAIKDQDKSLFNTEIQDEFLKINELLLLLEEMHEDFNEIAEEHNLSEEHFPAFHLSKKVEDKFSLSFIDKRTGKEKTILTEKESFENYKNISQKIIEDIKKNILTFSEGNFIYKDDNFEEASFHTATLNAAFLLQSLIEYTHSRKDMANLNIAVQMQVYTQLASTSLGTISDAGNIVKVVNSLTENPIQLLPKLIEKLQFFSFLLDSINLGSSIYELMNTHTDFEKEVVASNVGITAVNFSLGLAATTAYFAGATLTAEILGVLSVPIAGITIGLPSLVNNILKIKYNAQQVVRFFAYLSEVNKDGYYTLSDDKNVLIPSPLVPVTEINLKSNTVKVGDMKISKMHWGSLVSSADASYPLYFASPEAYNKGEPIEFSDIIFSNIKQNDLRKQILVLPSALNVRYYTEHNFVIGSARWYGAGEDTLDKIRWHYRGRTFHWRFYVAGGEKMITKLYPKYENTNIDIICDNTNRTFISALMSDEETAKKMSYFIKYGDNATYTYVFQHIPIHLKIKPLNQNIRNTSKWFFNIDNLVYNTSIKDDKYKKSTTSIKINSIIKFTKNNDGTITLKIGKQDIVIEQHTDEEFYVTFKYYKLNKYEAELEFDKSDYKEIDIILKLDLDKCKIDSLIVSCNMKTLILEQIKLLDYLKNFDLPQELLANVVIDINRDLPLDSLTPKVRGILNLLKKEYILSIQRKLDERIVYSSVINDKSFISTPDVIFDLDREDSLVFKKYNEKLKSNEYFLKGFHLVKDYNLKTKQDEKNKYLLKIINEKTVTLRNLKLNEIIFTELLYALLGQPTIYGLFNINKDIDHTTKEGKKEIISSIYDYICKNFIKNVISLSSYPKNLELQHKITSGLVISGKDLYGRNLNFIFKEDDYYLAYGEWETEIEKSGQKNYFKFNSLGKKELILSKNQNLNKSDYILLSETDTLNLQEYINSVVIKCSFETNRILFKEFTKKRKGENINVIDILLSTKSNDQPLVIYLPFKKEDLKWDVNGSSFIIYSSHLGKNKKFTILDAFNKNINKEIIISIDSSEPQYDEDKESFIVINGKKMDLISFMKTVTQYSGD